MTKIDQCIETIRNPQTSDSELLAILRDSSSHFVILNAMLAVTMRSWLNASELTDVLKEIALRPGSEHRLVFGFSPKVMAAFCLTKIQSPEAIKVYRDISNTLTETDCVSLEWLERNGKGDLSEIFSQK